MAELEELRAPPRPPSTETLREQLWADARRAVEQEDRVALIVIANEFSKRAGPRGIPIDSLS